MLRLESQGAVTTTRAQGQEQLAEPLCGDDSPHRSYGLRAKLGRPIREGAKGINPPTSLFPAADLCQYFSLAKLNPVPEDKRA